MCVLFPLALAGCGYDMASDSSATPTNGKINLENSTDQKEQKDSVKKQEEKTAATQLYLVDADGHVTPQVFNLPQVKEVAKQALSYLIQDGPVSDILPDGFKAVIPAGTTYTLNLDSDGTLAVDFSKDFKNYKAADEQKIMQSITWTLTQFDNIKNVKLSVNGKALDEMPVAKTPIPTEGLSRADGINLDMSDVADIRATNSVVVYYIEENADGEPYYVPVTKRYSDSEDKYTAMVDALKHSPIGDNLIAPFNSKVALESEPEINDKGVATLDFNENLYTEESKKAISDEALNCIALTFTGQEGIEKVAIQVKGNAEPVTESGKSLAEPVSKPDVNVNKTGV